MKSIEWLQMFTVSCLLAVLAMAPAAAMTAPGQGQGPAEMPATQKTQDLQLEGDGPWVVRIQTVDREALGQLAQWADVWSVHKTKGYTLVQVEETFATAEAIAAPTLIFWGDKDDIFPYPDQLELEQGIPRVTLLVYPDTGHGLHWERPELFTEDLVRFLMRR